MALTKSLDLEASSSQYAYINDGDHTGLDITGSLTIGAWVKLESQPSSANYGIVAKHSGGGSNRGYAFYYRDDSGTKKFGLDLSDNGTSSSALEVTVSGGITTSEWTHIAVTFTSGTGAVKFYRNGAEVGSGTHSKTSIANNSDKFVVGALESATASYFDGKIQDVRVYSDVRTATEIAKDAGNDTISDANLEGEWNFNDAYTDGSGNGNTLTSSGSPVFATDVAHEAPDDVGNSTDLATSLQGYWALEEASGTRTDETANGNDLTDNNTVGQGTGVLDNCADFESGNSEYLSITDASQTGLDITGSFSVSVWLKLESQPSNGFYGIIAKHSGGGSNRAYAMSYRDNGGTKSIYLDLSDNGTGSSAYEITISAGLPTGSWAHVVLTYTSGTGAMELFVDAVSEGTNTHSITSIANRSDPFVLGALESASTAYFDGLMDEVAIWSKVLTQGEIFDLYNGGDALPYSSGTAYTKELTDSVNASDSQDLETGKNLTESITAAITDALDAGKALTESITANATITNAIIYAKAFTESITTNVVASAKVTVKYVSESITAAASIARDLSRGITESITANAAITNTIVYAKNLTESITASITSSVKITARILTESITANDVVATALTTSKAITESITAGVNSALQTTKALTESISISAAIANVLTATKSLTESITTRARLYGLLNGVNMLWNNKYTNKAGTWINKYLGNK
jgi:hypothetical protein